MRGYPLYNFPAFHEAARKLRGRGYEVINPAELDEKNGFDPSGSLENFNMHDAIRRDVEGVLESDAVMVLPGWRKSKGALGEIAVARWAGKGVLYYSRIVKK